MTSKIIITMVLLFSQTLYANDSSNYSEITKQAWELYQKQQYLQSAIQYSEAIASLDQNLEFSNKQMSDHFNAACSFALAHKKDKAFHYLFQLANKAGFSNLEQLTNDGDLKNLHDEKKWKELIKIVEANYELIKPLNKAELKAVFKQYDLASKKVFAKGSTVDDVDYLYSFYTEDFIYNHPGYGDEYSRNNLYKNTVKYLKAGRYNDTKKQNIVNMIVGLNAIVVEQQYEGESETTMTLFKFNKNKISYIHEYW